MLTIKIIVFVLASAIIGILLNWNLIAFKMERQLKEIDELLENLF